VGLIETRHGFREELRSLEVQTLGAMELAGAR